MIIGAATLSCALSTYASDAKDTSGLAVNNKTQIQWTKEDNLVECPNVIFNATLPANKITQVIVTDEYDKTPCTAIYYSNENNNDELTITSYMKDQYYALDATYNDSNVYVLSNGNGAFLTIDPS